MLDETTFTQYYEEYVPRIFGYVSRRINNRDDVEDLVSMIFLKAVEQRDHFNPSKASFKTWLYKIATNTMIDFFRKQHKTHHTSIDEEMAEKIPSEEKPTNHLTEEHLQKAHIQKVIATLPDRYQQAILLRYFSDCSIEEMTQILEISPNNTSVLLNRAHSAFMQSYTRLTPNTP